VKVQGVKIHCSTFILQPSSGGLDGLGMAKLESFAYGSGEARERFICNWVAIAVLTT